LAVFAAFPLYSGCCIKRKLMTLRVRLRSQHLAVSVTISHFTDYRYEPPYITLLVVIC